MKLLSRVRGGRPLRVLLGGTGVVLLLAPAPCGAQTPPREPGSFSELDIEFAETRLTLGTVVEENRRLREQVTALRQSVATLADSLAISNSEAEVFRRQYTEARLQLEALGLDAIGTDRSALEHRLLTAISDLQIVMEEREKLAGHITVLNDLLELHFRTAEGTDPGLRAEIESSLRSANATLGVLPAGVPDAGAVAPSLTEAMVISLRDDLSLVVANVGSRHGVRIGMPFSIWRENRQIGTARVVDVRDRISGAIIQYLDDEATRLRVGDRLRVDAR